MEKNIDLGKKQILTSYRKIAIATWSHPRDPSIYSTLDLPVDAAMDFMATYPSETPLTLTHYVAKVTAYCLDKYPQLNHLLRGGNLYKRKQVDIFITTLLSSSKGRDLSGFSIRNVNGKSIAEVADISKSGTDTLRRNEDEEMLKVQKMLDPIPALILRLLMKIQEFLQFSLNLAIPSFGIPRDRFGSAMISNIGALGIEKAFIPLSPYARCPMIIGIGKPRKIPVVIDDKIVALNSAAITFTVDHRYADGSHVSHLIRRFKKVFGNPSAFSHVFEGDSKENDQTSL